MEREQKEARSTAVKWRLATDKREKEREREGGKGGHFGTGRIWAEKGFSPPRLLAAFICHTSQSPQNVGSADRDRSSLAWPAERAPCKKRPNLIQITKAAGVNCRRRFHHGLFAAKSTAPRTPRHYAPSIHSARQSRDRFARLLQKIIDSRGPSVIQNSVSFRNPRQDK